jgi:hypothetical protein
MPRALTRIVGYLHHLLDFALETPTTSRGHSAPCPGLLDENLKCVPMIAHQTPPFQHPPPLNAARSCAVPYGGTALCYVSCRTVIRGHLLINAPIMWPVMRHCTPDWGLRALLYNIKLSSDAQSQHRGPWPLVVVRLKAL